MASRYGEGSEGFGETLSRFKQQQSLRDELKRKNAELARSEEDVAGAEEASASIRNRIASETEAVARREAAANELQSAATRRDTSALEQNVAARRSSMAAMTEQEALYKRHQALQQGLNETQGQYRRSISTQGIAGDTSQALAAREAEIRRRMSLIEQQIQYGGGAPPPRVPPPIENVDPYGQRLLGPGRTTMVGGAQGVERTLPGGVPTGRTEAVRRLNQEIQANVAATAAQQAAVQREAVAEREAQAATDRVTASNVRASTVEAERRVATRESAVAFSALDQSMYRHGALTSEFIAAAARGEVTLRELGNQVLVTTGKFAGWTAAAGLVYGAYKAIKDLGQGAVDTQNQVQNLSRFIPNLDRHRAATQLRSLAQETNVPINEVGDAAGQFARVFHDQDQAMQAARASIVLTKLDNLSTADSYKALTAAIQGFHLQASDIPGLMDSINASQREFGANVSQITAGFGRAAGGLYLANPGQNSRQTAQFTQALLATIIRTTGGQGANVGIALSRAATRFVRQPSNQATLAGYGIDPTKGFDQIIEQAFTQIKRRRLGNQDITKIAQSIGGPAFGARYFSGLLTNPELFHNVLRDTSPEKAKGTAQEELTKKLHSFGEEIKSVGVNLQALGSELEQTGVFTPFQYAVVALAEMVKLGADVVHVFAGLPAPLRDSLLAITAIVGAMRLVGRFGGSGAITARIPGMRGLAGDDALFQRRLVSGLRTQRGEAYNAAEGYARTGVRSNIEAEAAARRAGDFQTENAAALRGAQGLDAQVVAEGRLAELNDQRAAAIERANEASARVLAAQQVALETDRELSAAKALSAGEARSYAARQGIPVPRGLDRPDAGPLEYPGGRGVIDPRTGDYFPGVAGAEAAQVGSREMEAVSSKALAAGIAVQSGFTALGKSGEVIGNRVAPIVTSAANHAAEAAAGVGARASALRARIGSLENVGTRIAAGVQTATRAMGLLDYMFIAFAAYEILSPLADNAQRDARRGLAAQQQQAATADQLRRQATAHQQQFSIGSVLAIGATHPFQPGAVGNYIDTANAREIARRGNQTLYTNVIDQQRIARGRGRPLPNLDPQQFNAELQKEVKDFKDGRLSQRQIEDAFSRNAIELRASMFITSPQQIAAAKQALAAARATVTDPHTGDYVKQLQQLNMKQLTALTTSTLRDLKAFGTGTEAGRGALSRLAAQLGRAEEIALNTGNEGDINSFAQIQEQITSGIQNQVQSDLQASLSLSRNEGQRQSAYATAAHQLHAMVRGPNQQVHASQKAYDDAEQRLADSRARLARARRQPPAPDQRVSGLLGPLGTTGPFGVGADPLGDKRINPRDERLAIDAEKKNIDKLATRLKQAKDYRAQALREYKASLEQMNEQAAQDYAAGVDAQAALAASRTQDKGAQIAIQIRAAGEKVRFDIQHFGRNNRITEQAIADQNNLLAQAAQEQLGVIQARGQLAQAQATTPAGEQQANLTSAQQALTFIKAHRKDFSLEDVLGAMTAVAQAKKALQQTNRQNAADLAQARYEYLESLTTDPLKIDQLQIASAQAQVKAAITPADRYRALAAVNKAKQQLVADRVSNREGDIQFALDMGKITTDQAEQDLQALLRVRGITKQQKQDIQRRIHDLQQQSQQEASGFDLNIGTIKLPTAYDVRRALAPVKAGVAAARQAQVTTTMQNNFRIDVANAEDAGKVYDAIDNALGTTVAANMRNAGLTL